MLRDALELHGPKFGCGVAQCGACTVHIDGQAVRSCVMPVSAVKGKVTTLEGLGSSAQPSKLQQAFIDEQAAQCGYCMNGMVMQAQDLLNRNPKPSETEIRSAVVNRKTGAIVVERMTVAHDCGQIRRTRSKAARSRPSAAR